MNIITRGMSTNNILITRGYGRSIEAWREIIYLNLCIFQVPNYEVEL